MPPAFPKSYENIEKLRKISDKNFSIFFKFFFDDFFFAESIRMYPNVSEYVKTGPKRAENVEKLRENVEKLRERLFVLIFINTVYFQLRR